MSERKQSKGAGDIDRKGGREKKRERERERKREREREGGEVEIIKSKTAF